MAQLRPRTLSWVAPGLATRLRQLTPRYALADGLVPCEGHLLAWLVTGSRRGWRRPLPPEGCCETRRGLEEAGVATIERLDDPEVDDPDGVLGEEVGTVWVLTIEGGEGLSINACPWCGQAFG